MNLPTPIFAPAAPPTARHKTAACGLWCVALLFFVSPPALAFPNWMGVFAPYERHTDANPGQYTTLMNQDYWGLHAELGWRLSGRPWQTQALPYISNIDGNSLWQWTPPAAYPDGCELQYYFHGWDDGGGNIWDSNDGQNYSFATPDETALVVHPAQQVDMLSIWGGQGSYAGVAAAVSGNHGFVAILNSHGSLSVLRLTLSPDAATVDTSVTLATETVSGAQVAMAARGQTVVVACGQADTAQVFVSTNGGDSYGQAQTVAFDDTLHELQVRAFAAQAFALLALVGPDDHGQALAVSRSTQPAAGFDPPTVVAQAHDTGHFSQLASDGDASGLYAAVLHPHLNIYYQPVQSLEAYLSADGQTWSGGPGVLTEQTLASLSLVATGSGAFIGWNQAIAGQFQQTTWVRRFAQGAWGEPLLQFEQSFGSLAPTLRLAGIGDQTAAAALLFQLDDPWVRRLAPDGTCLGPPSDLPAPYFSGNSATLQQMVAGPQGAQLLWLGSASQAQALYWQIIEQTHGLLGDANGDGQLTAGDAQVAFYFALGIEQPTAAELWRCDMDRNGLISAQDAQCIFYAVLGLPTPCDSSEGSPS